ncbi:unnamed protein product [Oncorhynchus mykiss]|uniref:Actin interacting protein 3-like C-terminal domain-containing protein n=1 Tax=Oncorhynchus mykiss TaxID=8022 RepID=A0A060VMH3_ONCMY|nr:unnamed protein product [Oncorhynchus mykiss]
MHREMMYASRDGQHSPRHPPMGHPPHHPMQGSLSPTTAHSVPPSPSRIPFGPRPGSMPCSATMPRERISNATPPVRSVSPCPSAILERRDVKPDEDMGGKSHSLVRGGEGLYADPYLLHEGRMGHGPAHGGHPPPGDMVDHGSLAGYHRASIRSTGSYSGPSPTEAMEQPSLYRQKSRNQLPTLGSKTPPPSPHRMAEVRMIDIHGATPPHGSIPLERSSPVRQAFRKEEVVKSRSNMASPVVLDLQGHGPIPPANDPQTRKRMKAMEQQIASLTGLVQHALLKSPNTSGTNDSLSERPMKTSRQASPVHSAPSAGGSPVLAPKSATPPSESGSTPILPGPTPFQTNLLQCKKNVSNLRLQLHQMRQLQLQNQEALRVQLKRAEQEISLKLAEAMRHLEDPVQRQRVLVEEDRHKYLGLEERVFNQLGELELYVDTLKRETGPAGPHRAVTLKHVEEGAVSLRRVGESLAGLKGEFPALQTRMRAVLRVEVEAVKFLKEEPHKLDSMLKRVKSLTETLSSLRRCATEGLLKGSDPAMCTSVKPTPSESSPVTTTTTPQSSSIRSEVVMPSSPMVIHHGRDSPSSAKGGSPAQQKKTPAAHLELATQAPVNNGSSGTGNLLIEEIHTKSKNRAMSIEVAEKEWEERRQNMGHYNGREFERILNEAQANMMKGIPSLDVPSEGDASTAPSAALEEPTPGKAKPAGLEKLPKSVLEKPATTKPIAAADKVGKVSLEKAIKSPPPPPPRKTFPTSSSGMTTTRSGEVVYTSRKESASGQAEVPPQAPASQSKPTKVPPETKPKPSTPPPIAASANHEEEEDEGDKIMAELQVFQKCTVKDVGVKSSVLETHPARVEPQIRELRPGALLPLKEKKCSFAITLSLNSQTSSEKTREDKHPNADENGNTTPLRQSPGVIYYVTGQISKEQLTPPAATDEAPEHRGNPTLSPSQEAPPPPDNIAFMITNSKVQALSCGEYQELVNAKRGIQTVTVALSSSSSSLSRSSSSTSELGELSGDGKPDGKKKFTFKFPKKQLAALSQAIRTGTKTGKKTLQVVVYEDEEESDGTVRQHKEAKRFEIQSRSKPSAAPANKTPKAPAAAIVRREHSDSKGRTDKIRKSTYKTLDSLEQTIKQLETTISEMGPATHHQEKPVRSAASVEPHAGCVLSGENGGLKRSLSLPSKSSLLKPSKASSQRKKTKPQLLPRPAVIPTATVTPVTSQQNATSVASPTSRMPVPLSAKSRQSPGTTTDKAGKQQKLQDSTQRQFRQANGSTKRAGGDHKTTSPTVPTSKIPAFYPSSGKGSTSQSAPNSDATNPLTLSSSSSSPHTTKSSIPSPHAPRHPGSALSTFSHIPSLSNGSSLKLPTPSHTGKALSFSSQTQNGRAPSSSSSPSPLSPTPLGPGVKSIRTIHTPSFTSYRPQNGSSGKSCIPTATAAKDST